MPDITVCNDDACPARAFCKRHRASGTVPDPHGQSVAFFERPEDADRCSAFVHVREPTAPGFGSVERTTIEQLRDMRDTEMVRASPTKIVLVEKAIAVAERCREILDGGGERK